LTALEIALLEIEVGEAPLAGREIQQVRVPLGEGVEFGEIPEEEEDPRANPVETALEHSPDTKLHTQTYTSNNPESGLVKPQGHDTRDLSPAVMFGERRCSA
jgi:hypothetical protein